MKIFKVTTSTLFLVGNAIASDNIDHSAFQCPKLTKELLLANLDAFPEKGNIYS